MRRSLFSYIIGNMNNNEMKKFTIITRPDPVSAELGRTAETELQEHGYIRDDSCPDTVFVIGGDGTYIHAVHEILRKVGKHFANVRFYGIHTGTLGFYTDYRDTDYREFMDAFLNDQLKEKRYRLLQMTAEGMKHHAINEVRIENPNRTQIIDVWINGEKFETLRGSGVCVCTQLGSSAFNRSLGGAVIQEGLDFIELTEMSVIHHSLFRSLQSSIILKPDTVIEFRSENFKGAILACDQDIYPLDDLHHITVSSAKDINVRVLSGREVSYFHRLKTLF